MQFLEAPKVEHEGLRELFGANVLGADQLDHAMMDDVVVVDVAEVDVLGVHQGLDGLLEKGAGLRERGVQLFIRHATDRLVEGREMLVLQATEFRLDCAKVPHGIDFIRTPHLRELGTKEQLHPAHQLLQISSISVFALHEVVFRLADVTELEEEPVTVCDDLPRCCDRCLLLLLWLRCCDRCLLLLLRPWCSDYRPSKNQPPQRKRRDVPSPTHLTRRFTHSKKFFCKSMQHVCTYEVRINVRMQYVP